MVEISVRTKSRGWIPAFLVNRTPSGANVRLQRDGKVVHRCHRDISAPQLVMVPPTA